ncbi:MAG TPA: hypothetical protein VF590_24555, partial [Isosphaeraceae bacterium]
PTPTATPTAARPTPAPAVAEAATPRPEPARTVRPEAAKAADAAKTARRTGPRSLWDRLGGQAAIRAVVRDFVARAARDPKVDLAGGGKVELDDEAIADLERLLVEFFSSATGGPLKYSGPEIASLREDRDITEAQFDAAAADLLAALKKFRIPAKETEELMSVVGGVKSAVVGTK